MAVCYKYLISFILLLRLVFTPILCSLSHITHLHNETFQSYNSLPCSLIPCLSPHVYHSPFSYCIFRTLSSHLTWTIFVFIYVFLHTISYFLLRSSFPSHCILYPRFSLNTPVSAVTDGRTSGTKNIEIKKQLCVNSAMNSFSIAERSSSSAKILQI